VHRAYSVCCAALRVPTAQKWQTTHLLDGLHVSLRGVPRFNVEFPLRVQLLNHQYMLSVRLGIRVHLKALGC